MRIKRSFELMLFFPFFAALCLEALTIKTVIYCPSEAMNWTEARLYCQKNYIDFVNWNIVDGIDLADFLLRNQVQQAWIGLLRDPGNASVWKWINGKSGNENSGDDLSQSSYWADGEPSSNCAAVKQGEWYSLTCSDAYDLYCSGKDKISYHNNILTWYNASQYCKTKSEGDLATITIKDNYSLIKLGWIGLYREAGETWSWIGKQTSNYRPWAHGEPRTADCGFFNPEKVTWHSSVCSNKLRFLCYDNDIVVVNKNKTWQHALEHCRGIDTLCKDSSPCNHSYDLLSLNVMSEQQLNVNYVFDEINRATSNEVWIGLRFLGGEWWWADGTQLEDQRMLPDCPSQSHQCGTLSKNNKRNWITRDCSERRNFICYRVNDL